MIETNLRIVSGGTALLAPVRYASVKTAHLRSEELERACNLLSYHHGLAARPVPGSENEIAILSERALSAIKIEDESATMTIERFRQRRLCAGCLCGPREDGSAGAGGTCASGSPAECHKPVAS